MLSINELQIKENEFMQQFCIKKIDELSSFQVMYEKQIVDRGHICDIKLISHEIGKCKVERNYYTYFLKLLQNEYVNLKESKKYNIKQLTI